MGSYLSLTPTSLSQRLLVWSRTTYCRRCPRVLGLELDNVTISESTMSTKSSHVHTATVEGLMSDTALGNSSWVMLKPIPLSGLTIAHARLGDICRATTIIGAGRQLAGQLAAYSDNRMLINAAVRDFWSTWEAVLKLRSNMATCWRHLLPGTASKLCRDLVSRQSCAQSHAPEAVCAFKRNCWPRQVGGGTDVAFNSQRNRIEV